jgi:GTPase
MTSRRCPLGELSVVTDLSGSVYVAWAPPKTGMLGLDAAMLRESIAVLTDLADEAEATQAAAKQKPVQATLWDAA